jgi:Tol biopolymer transport system component
MTSGPDRDARPVWSRDGKEVFFSASERHIARVPADRSTPPVTFFRIEGPDQIQPLSITPDGKRLLMMWSRLPERADLRVLELGSTPTTLTRLIDDSRFDQEGRLSPDGRWLVYESAESTSTTRTDDQIVVRPFPDIQAGRWVISRTGSAPIWSRDGREIFYRDDGAVMAVPVATTPTFKFGRPVRLMEPTSTLGGATYDVSLDGKRFLFIKAPDRDIRSLKVVLNWDVAVNATLAASGAAKR